MKRKYYATFNGFKKTTQRWGLKLINIKDGRNATIAREGTVNRINGVGYLGKLKKGDLIEFEAEVKEISFENPKNVKKTNIKFESENRNILSPFFDIKEKNP